MPLEFLLMLELALRALGFLLLPLRLAGLLMLLEMRLKELLLGDCLVSPGRLRNIVGVSALRQ